MRNDFDSTTPSFLPPRLRSKPRHGKFSFIAVQEEVQAPLPYGVAGARRMKVVRIEQETGAPSTFALPPEWRSPAARKPRRELLSARSPHESEAERREKNIRLRAVGKIMRDEAGNFYEQQGQQLRPLGELVLDEAGKIFEICSVGKAQHDISAPEQNDAQATQIASEETANGKTKSAETPPSHHPDGRLDPAAPPFEKTNAPSPPVYQKLFTDPGIRLQLAFGRIKREIAGQLQYPERLQENDVVECYVQFYEAHQPLPVAQIAAAEWGNAALQAQLHFLTKDKAQLLGVPQLYKVSPQPFVTEATARQLYPLQRVYQLRPIFDPTLLAQLKTSATMIETPQELKREIPAIFLNSAQFKYSREEVLYDMRSTFGTLPPECGELKRRLWVYPLRLLKILFVVLTTKNQMRKWRAMLAGKNLDEQLWTVTPPRGFSYHPSARHWAAIALDQAGYDSVSILLEWEIFWRRKGILTR